jgi:hypothetical protein
MRLSSILSVVCVATVGLLGSACKPTSSKRFEPYPREQGYIDASRPNCPAGYKAFLDYAKAGIGSKEGYETLQPTEPGGSFDRTVWAKVVVYAVEGENRIYVFTTQGHPAHPAVVIKSTYVNSEGVFWGVNGCSWGDRTAYLQFEAASQVLARQYRHETEQHPPPDAQITTAHVDLTEVFAEPADMVSKVAERAAGLNAVGRPATHIIALRPKAYYPPAITFDWLEAPPPSASKYEIMEASYVDYTNDDGAAAMAAWCGGREATRTPKLCAKAQERTATWEMIKAR